MKMTTVVPELNKNNFVQANKIFSIIANQWGEMPLTLFLLFIVLIKPLLCSLFAIK